MIGLITQGRPISSTGSLHAKFLGGKTAYALAVHCEPCGTCGRGHVISLFFKLAQCVGRDCLDLGDDMVGSLQFDDFAESLPVKHIEHMAAMGYLHGGRIGITVTGYHLHTVALQFNRHFLTEFSTPEQQRFACYRGHY